MDLHLVSLIQFPLLIHKILVGLVSTVAPRIKCIKELVAFLYHMGSGFLRSKALCGGVRDFSVLHFLAGSDADAFPEPDKVLCGIQVCPLYTSVD